MADAVVARQKPLPLRKVGVNDSDERKFKQFKKFYSKFYDSSAKFWTRKRKWWMNLTDEGRRKELNKRCIRCGAIGHNYLDNVKCRPLPVVFTKRVLIPVSYNDARRYRCSRCHILGHNTLGCHGPLVCTVCRKLGHTYMDCQGDGPLA